MNKKSLISAVAAATQFTKKDVTAVIDTMLDIIVNTVKSGEEVKIKNFGAFGLVERPARMGVNPQTREPIELPAVKSPHFKVSDAFKDAVKN